MPRTNSRNQSAKRVERSNAVRKAASKPEESNVPAKGLRAERGPVPGGSRRRAATTERAPRKDGVESSRSPMSERSIRANRSKSTALGGAAPLDAVPESAPKRGVSKEAGASERAASKPARFEGLESVERAGTGSPQPVKNQSPEQEPAAFAQTRPAGAGNIGRTNERSAEKRAIDESRIDTYVGGLPPGGREPESQADSTSPQMTKQQLKKFRDLLESKRQEIVRRAQQTLNEDMSLDANDLPDEMDLASSEYLQSFTFRLRGREKVFLDKIQKALEKIDNGSFGVCDDCGEKISIKRLEARPETTLCIRCKEDQERVEKDFS